MSEFDSPSAGSAGAKPLGNPTPGISPPPPLPAPLVSAQPAGRLETVSRPSLFLEKLASIPEGYLLERPEPRPYIFKPVYYFFYGTLMRPDILKGVLGLESDVILRDAKVYGYELINWGQYKALADGETGATVTGCAYLVQSVEEEYKLAYYETSAYKPAPCKIYFTDALGGEPAFSKTFLYAGDAQALKQGRFDKTLWEMQMGTRCRRSGAEERVMMWRREAKQDELTWGDKATRGRLNKVGRQHLTMRQGSETGKDEQIMMI